mmetsp:Transcript_7450/g.15472  ORF Transcript_7450/g.15472 Transcript_7450/m.15472 type:complete len:345 (-) Transcript_7450:12-1046(-)
MSINSAQEKKCSPSLSRTVRAVAYFDLAPLVLQNPTGSYTQVMERLTEHATPTCPFIPSDETEALQVEQGKVPFGTSPSRAFSLHSTLYPPTSSDFSSSSTSSASGDRGRLSGVGWACSVCGKRFKTLYYLDKHYSSSHSGGVVGEGGACLADSCHLVGCRDQMYRSLEYEETAGGYGPGSGTMLGGGAVGGGDGSVSSDEGACDDDKMENSRRACHEMVRSCVGNMPGVDVEYVGTHFCAKLSCHHRIHTLAGLAAVSSHGLKDVWKEAAVFEVGFWRTKGVIFVVAVFYTFVALGFFTPARSRGLERRRRNGWAASLGKLMRGGGDTGYGGGTAAGGRKKQF